MECRTGTANDDAAPADFHIILGRDIIDGIVPARMTVSESKAARYVEAALPVPLRRVFTYRVPAELASEIRLGTRLRLPFGKRSLTGYAVGLFDELPPGLDVDESKLKDVAEVLDPEPFITPEILELTRWTAEYYASFWGEMLKASLPAGLNTDKVRPKRRKAVRLCRNADTSRNADTLVRNEHEVRTADQPLSDVVSTTERSGGDAAVADRSVRVPTADKSVRVPTLTPQQQAIIDLLEANGGEMLFTEVLERADVGASPINTLAKRGIVEIYVEDVGRDPLGKAEIAAPADLQLTDDQEKVLNEIIGAVADRDEYKAFLLHGVTGSGKTEIYIRAMSAALDGGRSALMLVPEIALTPIFSRRLRAVFGSEVAILHSNLSQGERYDEWRRIRRGDARIAIGTRSAVFAPLENIGLIIVDEEHDPSYRQHESPFYHARDVAVMRANLAGAVVVLGSATPAMESFYNAQGGKYTYLQLPERIHGRSLAEASLIDMREVFKAAGKDVAIAPELIEAIRETSSRVEQSIILLNRRGFSQFVLCRTCGETINCRNCDITLTFHRGDNRLICHYCNYREPSPQVCPKCESEYLYFVGQGTENIADQLAKKFPDLRIARVDRDTMAHKGELEQVLLDFDAGRLDMLVGTQMISKGHDFPNVTLVGVLGIDIGLGLPDLRSAERTFQLLTQVAGRSGRGEKPGRVLIQTYHPDHYALRHAVRQDYEGFYSEEIRYRERMAYPPFWVLASIMIRHRDAGQARHYSKILRRSLDTANANRHVRILGPAPASIARLKNEFRLQIILKGLTRRSLREALEIALADAEAAGADLRSIFVEIDPVNLM